MPSVVDFQPGWFEEEQQRAWRAIQRKRVLAWLLGTSPIYELGEPNELEVRQVIEELETDPEFQPRFEYVKSLLVKPKHERGVKETRRKVSW